jgi:protein SEY1
LEAAPLQNKDYHTVAIIGCQSTGKSTLLNLLFNTGFDTLDALKGRNQTTKGIHLAYNTDCKCLIIDIEGTDSQVRGDDGAAFEQMSALFALAVSDVLMVNMWTSEIGRYKAASVGLLKTIFEANLKLFGQEGKKRILFVLRDYNDQVNNLVLLKQQISKTMEEIWDKIKKPSHMTLCNVFDCFEFDFQTVAVRDFKAEEFARDVDLLKDKFSNPDRNDYLFRYKSTDIPIDGVSLYYGEIWNIISSDKDLNIPSQKEMLANLRCNELKIEAGKSFQASIQPIAAQIGKNLVPELGGAFLECFAQSLRVYDEHASGYYEATYLKVRAELETSLLDQAKDLFHVQMKFVVVALIQRTKEQFSAKFPKNASVDVFFELANGVLGEIRNEFQGLAAASRMPDSDWELGEYESELENFFKEKIADEKEKQELLLEKEINNMFDGRFYAEVGKVLDASMVVNVWEELKKLQVRTMEPLEFKVRKSLTNLGRSDDEVHIYIGEQRIKCVGFVRTKVDKFIRNLDDFLMKKFTLLFSKDERGIPRDPKTTNYEEVFSNSKSKVLPILEQFRFFLLDPDWDKTNQDLTHNDLMSEDHYEKVMDVFLKDAERAYKDALHIKEFGYNRGGLPKWAILLIVLLGWNELLWVLRSPFILYPAIFAASIVALLFSMGLGAVPKLLFSQIIARIPFLL